MAKKNQNKQNQAPKRQPKKNVETAVDEPVEGAYTDRKLQLLMIIVLALPWVATAVHFQVQPDDILKRLYKGMNLEHALSEQSFLQNPEFWKAIAVFSTPHVFYLIVWTNARVFFNITKCLGEPFQVFAMSAHVIKMIQGSAGALYFIGQDNLTNISWLQALPEELLKYALALEPFQLILGLELALLGQLFNYYVYKTIGEAGVYYGCRLGQTVPWVFGFPFSVVSHPQYLGATLTIWGVAVLFSTTAAISQGLYGVVAAFTVFYTFSSFVEQYL